RGPRCHLQAVPRIHRQAGAGEDMETAITSAATGALLPASTSASCGFSDTNVLTRTQFTPTTPSQAAGSSSGTKALSWTLLEPTAPPPRLGSGWNKSLFWTAPQPSAASAYALWFGLTLMSVDLGLRKPASPTLTQSKAQDFICKLLSELTLD